MNALPTLPAGFEVLQPFVAQWGADTLSARDTARLESTAEERALFYTVMGGRVADAMTYLDSRDLASLTPGERKLMNLALSLIHVTLAHELQRDEEPVHAIGARIMPITRGHADRVAA